MPTNGTLKGRLRSGRVTIGSWVTALGFIVMATYLIHSLFKGKRAPENPWGAKTLEWTIPSPPSLHNFPEPPVVTTGPYEYGKSYRHSTAEA